MANLPIRRNGEHDTKDSLKLKASLRMDELKLNLSNALADCWDKTNFYFANHTMQGYERKE
jgi:hypothetical protein